MAIKFLSGTTQNTQKRKRDNSMDIYIHIDTDSIFFILPEGELKCFVLSIRIMFIQISTNSAIITTYFLPADIKVYGKNKSCGLTDLLLLL